MSFRGAFRKPYSRGWGKRFLGNQLRRIIHVAQDVTKQTKRTVTLLQEISSQTKRFIFHEGTIVLTYFYQTRRFIANVVIASWQTIRRRSLFFLDTNVRGRLKRTGRLDGLLKREGDLTGRYKRK